MSLAALRRKEMDLDALALLVVLISAFGVCRLEWAAALRSAHCSLPGLRAAVAVASACALKVGYAASKDK